MSGRHLALTSTHFLPDFSSEFIKAPTEVNLIGVNGGKVECNIFGVPKPKVVWYKDYHPLKETHRVQAHHYPPQVPIL
jgi:hypothetical protein